MTHHKWHQMTPQVKQQEGAKVKGGSVRFILQLSFGPQSSAQSLLLYSRRAAGTWFLAFGASVTVQTLMSKADADFFFATDGVAFRMGLIGFLPSTRSTDLIWTSKSSLFGGFGGGGMIFAAEDPFAFVTSCDSICTVTLPPGAFAWMERNEVMFWTVDPLSTERICVLTATPGRRPSALWTSMSCRFRAFSGWC